MSVSVNIPRSFRVGAALLLTIGVFSLSSCRSLSPKPASGVQAGATPTFSSPAMFSSEPPPLILGNTASPQPDALPPPLPSSSPNASTLPEERIIAFRPLAPEQRIVSRETPATVSATATPPAPSALPAPTISPGQVDELNRRIASLEKALSESEEKLRQARLPAPIPDTPKPNLEKLLPEPIPAVSTTTKKPVPSRPLPSFAIPGVSVVSDKDRIRIEVVDGALFTPGTWQLNTGSEETLRKIAGEIRAFAPEATLEIEGHTDNILTDPKNATQKHDISSYKAMIVMQYFVKTLLWKSSKITMSGYGPGRPVADNATPEGRAKNNRIDIVVSP